MACSRLQHRIRGTCVIKLDIKSLPQVKDHWHEHRVVINFTELIKFNVTINFQLHKIIDGCIIYCLIKTIS